MILKRFLLVLFSLWLSLVSNESFAGMVTFDKRADVHAFIRAMVNQYKFDERKLDALFSRVHLRSEVISTMATPKEAVPWYLYRSFFINPQRISQGVQFWQQHQQTLNKAQKIYGVPANIIVAIIGVETQYGHSHGKYRVVDSLSTLAFTPSSHQRFFEIELAQFLLLTREQNLDPLAVMGSYAGAIGIPQFMPSNYRNYGLSASGKKRVDLLNNSDDAILSVANYFNKHGWHPGQRIAVRATVRGNKYLPYINTNFKPQMSLAQFNNYNVKPIGKILSSNKAILIQLEKPNNNYDYWLGFNNFYVITTYNQNLHYAMAVYQLAQAIQNANSQTHNAERANNNSKKLAIDGWQNPFKLKF